MADEQIIYISPEEELTNVRERLEHAPARRIILVIPPQTQLRSHVGWRLLRSRARELNKDIVVNSSDRQIRAVAKAAGFRVADSLETPTTNKSRPPSRPGRGIGGGKTSSRLRGPIGRGMPDNRANSQRVAYPRGFVPADDRPVTQLSPEPSQTPQTNKESVHPISRADEFSSEAGSSTFGGRENRYGQDFGYHIETAPSIHPLSPPYEDEEPDLLMEDFNQAQNIRQAAQVGDVDAGSTEPEHPAIPSSYRQTAAPHELDDPFAYGEEIQPVSLPEQRGSIPMDELDTGVPDIGEVPTSIIVDGEIEDLGDEGDIVDPSTASPRSWAEPVMEEPGIIESPHIYGMRARNSRTGNVPRSPYPNLEDEDTLLPPEQPIRSAPPTPAASVQVPMMGNRPPQPIITQQPRMTPRAPTARPVPANAGKQPASSRSRVIPPPPRRQASRRSARGLTVLLTVLVLILLLLGMLFILIPSADITITLPSQSFSPKNPVTLTASANSRQDAKLLTVPATPLTFDYTTPPQKLTTPQGEKAMGYVTFTNSGSQLLNVPTGTPVATKSGVLFLTLGSAVVPANGTFPADPIIAKEAGAFGNVLANTITVIPSEGLSMIATASNTTPANISLSVVNANATSGGKAGSSSSGTNSEMNALKQALHQQMQSQFSSWMKSQVHTQDVTSTPVPDLPDSANPLPQEQFTIGQVASDGSFSGTDHLLVTLLVVRAADLQAMATTELNAAAAKQHPGYALISPSSLSLGKVTSNTSNGGKLLRMTFTPKGLIGQKLSNERLDTLRSQMAGRKTKDAIGFLKSNASGLMHLVNAQVTLFPGFSSSIPFWTAHINIHMLYRCVSGGCPKG